MPWLARGRHIGSVCSVLERAGVDETRWTVSDLLWHLEQHNRSRGITIVEPASQKDPLAYLGWLLRAAINSQEPTPTEMREIERARVKEEQERVRKAAQLERERLDAEDPSVTAAIIAKMRADMAAEGRYRKHRRFGG